MPSSKDEVLNLKKRILEKYGMGVTIELDLGDGSDKIHVMDIMRDSTDEWIVVENFPDGGWGFSYMKDYSKREPFEGLFEGPDKFLGIADEVFQEVCKVLDKKQKT